MLIYNFETIAVFYGEKLYSDAIGVSMKHQRREALIRGANKTGLFTLVSQALSTIAVQYLSSKY